MKEILVIIAIALLSLVALINPRIGVIGYTWFALMRPDALSWSRVHPYSMILAVSTLVGSLLYLPEFGRMLRNPISRCLLLFLIPVTISSAFAVNPDLSWPVWGYFTRVVLMALLIVVFIRTERELRTLLIVIAGSLGIIGLKFGLFGLLIGNVEYMEDLEGTMLSDNNMLALALAMVMPLCWYLAGVVTERFLRLGFYTLAFGSVAGVVMTNSRGGALSLAVALVMIALRSNRKFLTVVVIAIFTIPVMYVVRDKYLARLSTITANEAEADGSIKLRIDHRRAAFAMWKDYPLFGVGYGMENYVRLAPQYLGYEEYHVVHNTYFQILADAGIFAFTIYVCLLFGTIVWLQRSASLAAQITPGKEVYPIAIQTGLAAFAVGSYFLSRDSFDLLYILLMSAAAWYTIQKTGAFDEGTLEKQEVAEAIYAPIGVPA